MRILTLTRLYPNCEMPTQGIFVENRLRRLVETGDLEARVIAPVGWFPSGAARFGAWGSLARVPIREERHGLRVDHPRYPAIPRIGLSVAAHLLYGALLRPVRRCLAEAGGFDLVDAHYAYPDGVAAAWIAQRLGKPIVISARGSDLNDYATDRHPGPARMIRKAIVAADRTITVSEALRQKAIALGAEPSRVCTLRNGVDLEIFHPRGRAEARRRLGLDETAPTIVSVGNLREHKGHSLAIDAATLLPDTTLLIVGEGPDRSAFERRVRERGLSDRVRFLGSIPHEELSWVYSAANVLVLASSREGWPNVLLESMACGTPVVASEVGGVPEIVGTRAAGTTVRERSAEAFASALGACLSNPPDAFATRAHAQRFDWGETVRRQVQLYRDVVDEKNS